MKLLNPIRLSVGLAALFVAQAGWAAGTQAGTPVTNTATLDYSVGGIDQADITSAPANFLVDRKIDLVVTGNSSDEIPVTPSSTGDNAADVNQLIYTLANDGNDTQDFSISLSQIVSPTDDFDADNCKVFVNDVETSIVDDLAPDAEATITVACDIPVLNNGANSGVEHGHISTIDILATALNQNGTPLTDHSTVADTAGSDPATDVQNVFADGAGTTTDTNGFGAGNNNAAHSATQSYIIEVPMLSITKVSSVVSDPTGLPNPKRIPGAIIEYTIQITNATDASQAKNVTVKDTIEEIGLGQVSYVAGSLDVTGEVTDDTPNAEVAPTASTTPAYTLQVDGIDIDPGTTVTVTFQVEINSTSDTFNDGITYP